MNNSDYIEYQNKVQRQAKRIAELEAENKHLEDYIDAYQKSEAINIAKLDEKDKRIKELESIPHTDNTSVIDALQNRIRELEARLRLKLSTPPPTTEEK